MALITTAATGNYSATTTWAGGVVPGLADTIKLLHQVTLDVNASCAGVDTASTAALVSSNGGLRLLIGAGGLQFIVKPLTL